MASADPQLPASHDSFTGWQLSLFLTQYVLRMNGATGATCCSSSIRCIGRTAKSGSFFFFAPLPPAAELEASPSISRLMNAAARPVSPVRSSRLCSLDCRNMPEMRSFVLCFFFLQCIMAEMVLVFLLITKSYHDAQD